MRKLILAILVAAVITAGVVGFAGWWTLLRPIETVEVDLVVDQGASATEVLRKLHDHGLLPSVLSGRIYLQLFGKGRSPRFGHYLLPSKARPVDAIEIVLSGAVETFEVTVIEGVMCEDVCEMISAAGCGSNEKCWDFVSKPDSILDLAPEARTLEGFLFPDTYRFAIGISAQSAAHHMVDRFRDVWREEYARVSEPWATPYEIVTLASLVEGETSLAEERARVAGVYFNRLKRGMLLQCDPTVIYALKKRKEWTGRLLRIHWKFDDPYNTYLYGGLPPGPINNPGRAALSAALSPEDHNFLYFVAKPDGGHTFSRTLDEHNRAVWRLRRSRR